MLQGFFTISDAGRLRSKLLLDVHEGRKEGGGERGGGTDGGVCRPQRHGRLQ